MRDPISPPVEQPPTRILLVEDNIDQAGALAHMFDATPGWKLAGIATDYRQARSALQQMDYDLVLLDLRLGEYSSIDLIQHASSQSKVVVFTVHGQETTVVDALMAGAAGYLIKGIGHLELCAALQAAQRGESPLSPKVAGCLLRHLKLHKNDEQPNGDYPTLTQREREILRWLARGLTYKEAAARAGISFHTVAFHVKQIYEKLRVHSRGEAVFLALRDGLIEVE